MESYQTYLILFMAGIIIGLFAGLSLSTGSNRRAYWEYQTPATGGAYTTYPPGNSSFWLSVFIGVLLLAFTLVLLRAGEQASVESPVSQTFTETLHLG